MVVHLKFALPVVIAALLVAPRSSSAERINHEGRILGPAPVVTNAVLFNTGAGDAIVSALQIFPTNNPWNEDISGRPVLTNSDAMIAQINADVPAANRKLSLFQEMNYVFVPDTQALATIKFTAYPDESELNGGTFPNGRYPIPSNMPIETWPTGTGSQTLAQWQTNNTGDDRHSIVVQPGNGKVWETWQALLRNGNWEASNGALFNLNSNALRPDGWTSGDAAGFPMFPALVRYDECQRGMVEHACRLVVVHSRNQHIYPATHHASSFSGANYPSMGQRLRLKASFVIPAGWTKEEKALILGLKKYGAMVSDNSSSFFSISITPDDRWGNVFSHIKSTGIGITNFEVVQTTGPTAGPRSPGAPTANAGLDANAAVGVPFQLQGVTTFTIPTTTNLWKLYSGPTNLTFANASLANTTVTFATNGIYTLMLSAADGTHAVAYDATVITVGATPAPPILLKIGRSSTNVTLNWTGGTGPFVIERKDSLPAAWSGIVTTSQQSVTIPMTNASRFFRIRGS